MTRDPTPNDLTHQKTAEEMLADENFGPREIDELAKKFVLKEQNDEELSKDELETVLEIAKERNFYLDEGDEYFELAQEVEEILDQIEEEETEERIREKLEDFKGRNSFVEELREEDNGFVLLIDETENHSAIGDHSLMELGRRLGIEFPRTEFNLKHGHSGGGAEAHVTVYWNRGGRQ